MDVDPRRYRYLIWAGIINTGETRNSHEAFGVGPRDGLVTSVGAELAGQVELVEDPTDM